MVYSSFQIRRSLTFIFFFLLFSTCLPETKGASSAVQNYYVSPQGNDAWSGRTPDPADHDGPFRTLVRARDAVREQIANGMTGDIEVLIRGGDYYLETTLNFDARDSGRDGFKVIYRNHSGEQPVIHSGRAISGWERYEGNIYRAVVGAGWDFSTLSENGAHSISARHPNKGYWKALGIPGAEKETQTRFRFRPADVPQIDDPRHLQVFIWPAGPYGEWNWFTDLIPVRNIDYERHILTLRHPARYIVGAGGSRYYLQGALQLLDQPGEFYLDHSEGLLYYWPRELPIEDQKIVAPLMTRTMGFVGSTPSDPVRQIQIEGLTITGADFTQQFAMDGVKAGENAYPGEDGMVYLENAEDITIIGCKLHSAGMHGVYLNQWAQRNTIANNLIYDVGFTGVLLNHAWLSTNYASKQNRILNNYIHHTGRLVGHGTGIQIVQSGENLIAHNLIHDTPRYAISFKSPRPGTIIGTVIDGIVVTADNVKDFILTRNNIVEFNDLSRANLDSQDTGVIESWGVAFPGSIIRNNRIHHSDIPFSFGFGIYMDDASNGFIVEKNVVHDLQTAENLRGKLNSVFMIKGVGSQIVNNIAAYNNATMANLESFAMADEPNSDLEVVSNIFYESGYYLYRFINWDDRRFAQADHNLFYNGEGVYRIFVDQIETYPGAIPTDWQAWQAALGGKYDQNSITADPLFMDGENRDLRLRYDSPAYALGFEDIDGAAIGLQADFPFADSGEALDRLFIASDRAGHSPTVRLMVGEEAKLSISGRTVTGYVADLSGAAVTFTSDNPNAVSVNADGIVRAETEGIARVTASITRNAVTTSIDIFVLAQSR